MDIVEAFMDRSCDPPLRGSLHRPEMPNGDGLVFTHGAGGNAQGPMLVALAEAFARNGVTVLRCDLPFRQNRSVGPPRPGDAARDRAGLKCAVEAMRKLAPGRVFLGGQSYGGRQATMLIADEPGLVDGLLLTSYPLHPPGKPQQLRVEHFPKVKVPTLFVEGTKDPFATLDEIKSAVKMIPARTDILVIDGVGHDLGFRGKKGRESFGSDVVARLQQLMTA
jgi:predicted alpha/beta-hydrolase family hydrolase